MDSDRIFLTAEWRYLALLNYEVDPGLLLALVPAGTELDFYDGKAFISLVGFRFLDTRVFGFPVPFHSNFDEVNLRFYVRRRLGSQVRRGVVFIREVVPRWAIAAVARTVYNENYVALPIAHLISRTEGGMAVEYRWKIGNSWSVVSVGVEGEPRPLVEGSHEQFIAEHYWGYAAQKDAGSVEYRVTHPSWRVWTARIAKFEGNVEELYGHEFAAVLRRSPSSALLAEGSAVEVMRGRRLRAQALSMGIPW